ncbi:hypothetical protein [Marinobacter confluentis]|uniref:DUF995 domain-containing protein n=1 Tax=Marinobacter confluentis TaxID=1697557 RepID=A0A4Z1BG16_9GAMM|nr:hypothetical protein [Marinobacter confluentis]TGN41704.1 hypothetical protein E5Q11_04035 [Marinobacter confluentis]
MLTLNAKKSVYLTLAAAVTSAALLVSGAANANSAPSAQEISDAVSDHSYQGSMSEPNSGFNEYYAPDGTIHGKGYTGEWTTRAGEMCFAYGEGPTCYGVSLDGPSMVLRMDGEIKGSGMLIPGNTVK